MQYNVEDLGPLKKKIEVTVPAADAEVIVSRVTSKYRASVNVPGFRKGKAPLSMIEKQYKQDIYAEATNVLVDTQVRNIIAELKLEPAGNAEYDAQTIEKGEEYKYSFTLEFLPEFDLPDYNEFPVEEEKAEVTDAEVDEVLEKARNDFAELIPVSEAREPKDGDIVTVDFIGFDEEGKEIPGIKADNIQMPIGMGQALEDFEKLVKKVKAGNEGEENITFPEDFPNTEFAGKTIKLKVKVHSISERKLPALDDAFALSLGQFKSLDEVRVAIRTSFMQQRMQICKAAAQKKMLQELIAKVEYPLPEGMVERFAYVAEHEVLERLRRQNQTVESVGKTMADLKDDARKEAENYVRTYIFLNRAAKKEELTVSEQELLQQLQQIAKQSNRDFSEVRDEYVRNDMIGSVHDRVLADKAMQAIYDKAKITYIDAVKEEEAPKTTEKGKAAAKKAPAKKTESKK